MRPEIPDKLFYKIGEVCKLAGVEAYTLRYWETEFPFLSPRKSRSGQRVYTREDAGLVLDIRDLLYKEGYTLEGVRKRFVSRRKGPASDYAAVAVPGEDSEKVLGKVKRELEAIAALMDGNKK